MSYGGENQMTIFLVHLPAFRYGPRCQEYRRGENRSSPPVALLYSFLLIISFFNQYVCPNKKIQIKILFYFIYFASLKLNSFPFTSRDLNFGIFPTIVATSIDLRIAYHISLTQMGLLILTRRILRCLNSYSSKWSTPAQFSFAIELIVSL